jgi:hypothetical protein
MNVSNLVLHSQLGLEVLPVAKDARHRKDPAPYMRRTSPQPVPYVRTFLASHARDIVAIDFFLVPTLTFRLLFVFVILRHHRRELIHINVTDHPTAVWTARQIVEAFPDDAAPTYLLRDRDRIYGAEFARRVERMRIREVLIAPDDPLLVSLGERPLLDPLGAHEAAVR